MRIILAVGGASGSIYAQQLAYELSHHPRVGEVAMVLSKNAAAIWKDELGTDDYLRFGFTHYRADDFYSPPASGSSRYDAMVIVPASMGQIGRIAHGVSDNLIVRAADVMLKERRKLIVVPREAPYNLIHLRNMVTLTEAGAIICPATPSFYSKPESIEQLVATVTHRILDLLGLPVATFRWKED
ncbi:MAG: UbiX family flavin prenyltransferase [Bacteroidales bacterium]